jgi:N-acetyltransferase
MDKFLAARNKLPAAKKSSVGGGSGGGGSGSSSSWQRLFSSSSSSSGAASSAAKTGLNRKRPAPAKEKTEQMYLDFGQRSFGRTAECRECGFIYAEGEPSDEAAHRKHHRKAQQGVRVRGSLAGLRVVSNEGNGDRIIMLRPDDGAEAVRKLHEVRVTLELALGGCSSSSSAAASGPDEPAGFQPPTPLPASLQAYLFLEGHSGRLRGCAFAEAVSTAFHVVPPDLTGAVGSGADAVKGGGGDPDDFFANRIAALHHDGVPCSAMCGISHIWVDARDRRQGVARALLDAVREHFAMGFDVPLDQLAFSQPTSLGRRLAVAYTGAEAFLVYE